MEKARFRRDLDKKVGTLLETIPITRGAFMKMNAYARAVSMLAGDHIECGGLLVGEHREGLPVITDATLLDAIVTHASGHFDHDRMNEEYLQARNAGKLIMGMWHSHGNFGVFHSSHDDACLEGLLDRNERIVPNLLLRSVKETPLPREHVRITDTSLCIRAESGQAYEVHFAAPDDGTQDMIQEVLGHIDRVSVRKSYGVPFAASIVINKESYDNPERVADPTTGTSVYAEAVAKYPSLKGKRLKCRGIPLLLIGDDTDRIDWQSVEEEVASKIIYQGRKLSARTQESGQTPTGEEGKIDAQTDRNKMIIEDTIETVIEKDPLAEAYERIVQSPEYEAAINRKAVRKYTMLQARRLLRKLGQDDARRVYAQYTKEQDDGQAQKKMA